MIILSPCYDSRLSGEWLEAGILKPIFDLNCQVIEQQLRIAIDMDGNNARPFETNDMNTAVAALLSASQGECIGPFDRDRRIPWTALHYNALQLKPDVWEDLVQPFVPMTCDLHG